MINVTMFIRDEHQGNRGIGVATLIYDKGKFGVGVSVLNDKDKFDKLVGRTISYNRALESLKTNPFDQISQIEDRFEEALEEVIPGLSTYKFTLFWIRFNMIKEDIVLRMAKEFMKGDTV